MVCLDIVMNPFYTKIILILNCLLLGELKGQSVMLDYQDHVDLAYYLTEHGQKRAVKTQTDWEIRKLTNFPVSLSFHRSLLPMLC